MKELIHHHAALMRQHLDEVDHFAAESVASGKGGPFGARLVLFAKDKAGNCSPYFAMPVTSNRVLETGLASQHAEAEALDPAHISALKMKIRLMMCDKQLKPVVILFSSSQPCMACLTKIEICARHLVEKQLIHPKDFILVYGANYEETEKIAGFNDYAYALDFFNYKNGHHTSYKLINQTTGSLGLIPPQFQEVMSHNTLVKAIVTRGDCVLGLGYDQRDDKVLFRTAECTALHAASNSLKLEGSSTPWNLGGACLYTFNQNIGPLCYTECQWAAVGQIICLAPREDMPHTGTELQEQDCPSCDNNALFQHLSDGYNAPWSMVHVVRDARFANLAQKEWARKSERIYYNGHEAGAALTMEEKQVFDSLFVPALLKG